MLSSRESSQPRDQTQVSRIAGSFFTVWAIGEAHIEHEWILNALCWLKQCRNKTYMFHDSIYIKFYKEQNLAMLTKIKVVFVSGEVWALTEERHEVDSTILFLD